MKIKICGITTPEDAAAVLETGADFIGIVHYPKSKRHCGIEKINEILDAVEPLLNRPYRKQETVLVVADSSIDEVEKVIDASYYRFDYVQIHRDLTDKEFADFYNRLHKKTNLIRVIQNTDKMQELIKSGEKIPAPQFYLLEISHGELPGGNGAKWDWTLAKEFCKKFPAFIAGGVQAEDISGIAEEINPFGIDLSSNVEVLPGVKDIEKVRQAVLAAEVAP